MPRADLLLPPVLPTTKHESCYLNGDGFFTKKAGGWMKNGGLCQSKVFFFSHPPVFFVCTKLLLSSRTFRILPAGSFITICFNNRLLTPSDLSFSSYMVSLKPVQGIMEMSWKVFSVGLTMIRFRYDNMIVLSLFVTGALKTHAC